MIEINNISKVFRTSEVETVALNHVSLDVKEGEFVAIMGPSGCGKSTLLNILGLLDNPTEGSYKLLGQEVADLKEKERTRVRKGKLGFVFQSFNLIDELNVYENVELPLTYLGVKASERKRMVEDILKRMNISHRAKHFPQQLSGGQQQRVAIARALVKMPRVLLLDEPLSNLDARLRLQTREEIRRIQRETKITTIFVTHDQEEALSISDLIVVMKEGILQQIGKPQEVYDQPANLFVAKFLGTPPINVFSGKVTDGQVKIGEETVLLADLPDQEVTVGIRPEGFVVDEDGTFSCALKGIEVLGRDISIVASHPAAENASIRAIVGSTRLNQDMAQAVFFSLKTDKVFLFDAKDGSRIETALKRPAGKRS